MRGQRSQSGTNVEKVKEGNRRAFSDLVAPHLPRLLLLARRMTGSQTDAEDAVQSALASIWVSRAKLDPTRAITPYLTTAVLNQCRDRLRRRGLRRFLNIGSSGEIQVGQSIELISDEPNAEQTVSARERLVTVRAEIDKLPIRLREALLLVTVDDRSHSEAAELLGVTEKTIEMRIYRARKRLRKMLKKFEG
ncbi:sigma-70 family RNA polymerase sigma factor [Porphyrobacter algicida]|uniref:Sigma-70 family RNA polymerase sigma factor n=1 Tax=Qipengyuania algicida TaxID=1836209 RepID=A0A845AG89_9SPHN|nr:sigma-70 family RNA polymerase sigma factor [Qipengyuania algicida]